MSLLCHGEKADTNIHSCFECYWAESIAGVANLTADEMRQKLREHHVNVQATATYRELMLLYEDIVNRQKTSSFKSAQSSVLYPSLPSSFFSGYGSAGPTILLSTKVVDFRHIVWDELLPVAHICQLVSVLSALVTLDNSGILVKNKVGKRKGNKYAVHGVMAKLLIEFAEGSRINFGLRLLK